MMNPKEAEENFKSILSALRGQSVVLPDLNAIFDGWPREISRHYDQLHRDLDDWLDRYDSYVLIVKFSQAPG